MNTSVYIPADYSCMDKLSVIVSLYNSGTVKPDEIVINAFGVVSQESLDILKNIQNDGHDNVVIYAKKINGTMAENRNYAYNFTNGDIVMFHNPKMLPSNKRVEIIKKYFEDTDVYVVNHVLYHYDVFADNTLNTDNLKVICSSDLYKRYFPFGHLPSVWNYTRTYGQELGARGLDEESVCVLREVLKEFTWKKDFECELFQGSGDGMFYDFLLGTLYKYKKSSILNIPLTIV